MAGKRAEQREQIALAWLNDYVQLAVAAQQGNSEAAEVVQARLEELVAVGQPLDRVLEVHRKRLIESADAQLAELTESKVRKALTEQADQTRRRANQQRKQLRALRTNLGSNGAAKRPAKRARKARR